MNERERAIFEQAYRALTGEYQSDRLVAAVAIQELLKEPQPCKCVSPAYCELNDRCSKQELKDRGVLR